MNVIDKLSLYHYENDAEDDDEIMMIRYDDDIDIYINYIDVSDVYADKVISIVSFHIMYPFNIIYTISTYH